MLTLHVFSNAHSSQFTIFFNFLTIWLVLRTCLLYKTPDTSDERKKSCFLLERTKRLSARSWVSLFGLKKERKTKQRNWLFSDILDIIWKNKFRFQWNIGIVTFDSSIFQTKTMIDHFVVLIVVYVSRPGMFPFPSLRSRSKMKRELDVSPSHALIFHTFTHP